MTKIKLTIPNEVLKISQKIEEKGFEAFLVGGCVRDLLINQEPKDWDITTNAHPEEIEKIFEKTVYKNDFGTVIIVNQEITKKIEEYQNTLNTLKEDEKKENKKIYQNVSKTISQKELQETNNSQKDIGTISNTDVPQGDIGTISNTDVPQGDIGTISNTDVPRGTLSKKTITMPPCGTLEKIQAKIKETEKKKEELKILQNIEITTYRKESQYKDNRHPQEINFVKNINEDLERRDFTINAIAYRPKNLEIIDLFGGINDIQKKIIKTVKKADDRFSEDALRILRAVRLSAQLNFEIEKETQKSILKNENLLEHISKERIRDEFVKIILSENPYSAFLFMKENKLLKYISDNFEKTIDCQQNGSHIYDVFTHLLKTLQYSAEQNWSLEVRLASLFHDIGKPKTKRFDNLKKDYTFYNHEVVGATKTEKILNNLKFERKIVEKVTVLVRYHMFFSDPEKIKLSGVKRIIRKVEPENVWDLIKLRISDRIGMGRPVARSYRLRQYEALMEEAMRIPITVKDLKINGNQIIEIFKIKPGKKIGFILNALMKITLDEPEKNNFDFLKEKTSEFLKLDEKDIQKLAEEGKKEINKKENEELTKIKKKHKVK